MTKTKIIIGIIIAIALGGGVAYFVLIPREEAPKEVSIVEEKQIPTKEIIVKEER